MLSNLRLVFSVHTRLLPLFVHFVASLLLSFGELERGRQRGMGYAWPIVFWPITSRVWFPPMLFGAAEECQRVFFAPKNQWGNPERLARSSIREDIGKVNIVPRRPKIP